MRKKYRKATQAIGDSVIRRMRIACWISKATDTYVMLIAFPLQQLLHKCVSVFDERTSLVLLFGARGWNGRPGTKPWTELTSVAVPDYKL